MYDLAFRPKECVGHCFFFFIVKNYLKMLIFCYFWFYGKLLLLALGPCKLRVDDWLMDNDKTHFKTIKVNLNFEFVNVRTDIKAGLHLL